MKSISVTMVDGVIKDSYTFFQLGKSSLFGDAFRRRYKCNLIFENCTLTNSFVSCMFIYNSNITNCKVRDVVFIEGCDFENCNVENSIIESTNINNSFITDSKIDYSQLNNCNIKNGCYFKESEINNSTINNSEIKKSKIYNCRTYSTGVYDSDFISSSFNKGLLFDSNWVDSIWNGGVWNKNYINGKEHADPPLENETLNVNSSDKTSLFSKTKEGLPKELRHIRSNELYLIADRLYKHITNK